MILDLARFVGTERAYWTELESMLDKLQVEPCLRLTVAEIERLHYLYERSSADLVRLDTFASEPQLRAFLETLVARAYSEIHETRARRTKVRWRALLAAFPRAFRRHLGAFLLSLALTLAGCAFGWTAIRFDPQAKAVLMPFEGLMGSPAERVQKEESMRHDRLKGAKGTFAAELMTHNIRVTWTAFALGLSWGVGTIILLFYNGVILGAVAADYVAAGQSQFLAGWLLPHGAVEIPAILVGGQAGLILAGALIGWGKRLSRTDRLRQIAPDLLAIAVGAACLLVWAGIVESFVSQYHRPVLPYEVKIAFGLCELVALSLFLWRAGRE